MMTKERPSKPPTAQQVYAEGSGVEIKGCCALLTAGQGQTEGACQLRRVQKSGEQQVRPQKSAAEKPKLGELLGGLGEHKEWRLNGACISPMLILLDVFILSLQPQPLPAPLAAPWQPPGSSGLCSYIRLLSEARRACGVLCLSGTNFPPLPGEWPCFCALLLRPEALSYPHLSSEICRGLGRFSRVD